MTAVADRLRMAGCAVGFWLLILPAAPAAAASPPAGPPGPPTASPPAARPSQWESYRVLSERNMFLRNRASPASRRPAPTAPPAAPPAATGDDRIVLTGIVHQGEDYVAFFEDTRTGKTAPSQIGAALGRGRLAAITLDAVQYACDGNTTRIAIGSNLSGAAASLPKPAAPPSAPAAPAAAPAAPPAGRSPAAGEGPTPATAAGAPAAAAAAASTAPPAADVAAAAAPATPATAASSTTQPSAAPPQAAAGISGGTTDPGAAGILERMRQRREQELNR
ncbi:MAG: hypothetical protein FJ288_01285 [Planctomycetes bacterium]|nr:hypothetical protein [Planctomycetota bacterium]